jgi:hypothetical protein
MIQSDAYRSIRLMLPLYAATAQACLTLPSSAQRNRRLGLYFCSRKNNQYKSAILQLEFGERSLLGRIKRDHRAWQNHKAMLQVFHKFLVPFAD